MLPICRIRDSLGACSHGDVGTLEVAAAGSRAAVYIAMVPAGTGFRLEVCENRADAARLRLLMHETGGEACTISFQHVDTRLFLAITHTEGGPSGGSLTLTEGCIPSCKFIVGDLASGAWALRVAGGGALSPVRLDEHASITTRPVAEPYGWEAWLFRLASIPVVDVSPLVRLGVIKPDIAAAYGPSEQIAFVDRVEDLPPSAQHVCFRLGKAARDMGFYNVIGHGIALDLVSLVKAQAVGMTEGAEVDNFAFWTTWGSRSKAGAEMPPSADWPGPVEGVSSAEAFFTHWVQPCPPGVLPPGTPAAEVISTYAAGCVTLEKTLLHALALCEIACGGPATWRKIAVPRPDGTTLGRSPPGCIMAVRALRYPPGPIGSCGMGRHRDATWLTLLSQDDVGGLAVMIEEDGKPIPATPVAGALLVNAGMSLQEFSGGYYSAVRHEVVRIRADVPRVSVVFFNDATDRPRTTGG